MVRRDRQAPLPTSRQQRSGVIPRAALRKVRPSTARRDWLGGVIVAVLAVMVLAVISGVFRVGGDGLGAPAAAVSSASPSSLPLSTAPPILRPTDSPTPSPTRPPTPTPTRPPTPTPTAMPTATPRPTASPAAAPTIPPITAGLVILKPADGEVVDERTVSVRGLGPAGATITHDIPFWFDAHTTADGRGRWSFSIDLVPGDNELTFRIGDDTETSRTLTVVYEPD